MTKTMMTLAILFSTATGCMDDSQLPTDGGCEIDATMHSNAHAGDGLCDVRVYVDDATGLAMTVSLTDSRGVIVVSKIVEPGSDTLFSAVTCDIFLASAVPNGTGPSCKLNVGLD